MVRQKAVLPVPIQRPRPSKRYPDLDRVIPLSILFGGAFLILADLVGRSLIAPAEIPIGVITAFLGAPFFLVVLRRSTRAAA